MNQGRQGIAWHVQVLGAGLGMALHIGGKAERVWCRKQDEPMRLSLGRGQGLAQGRVGYALVQRMGPIGLGALM